MRGPKACHLARMQDENDKNDSLLRAQRYPPYQRAGEPPAPQSRLRMARDSLLPIASSSRRLNTVLMRCSSMLRSVGPASRLA